jgi:hypothetical protein
MKVKATLLLLIFVWSCSTKEKATEEFLQRLNKVDMIEFKNGDNSVRYVDLETLKTLKEILLPTGFSDCEPSDNHTFPLSIFLYSNSEVIGEIGVESGDNPKLHYKINDTCAGKSEMNSKLGMFIQDLQF